MNKVRMRLQKHNIAVSSQHSPSQPRGCVGPWQVLCTRENDFAGIHRSQKEANEINQEESRLRMKLL